ncbi:hypothetical protein HMPREF3187_01296 [Aerococcus christensenii]|uniref:Uncharacterized protein n=1 Tax=Aerococcus christensenii TaxID=87541 RepID=A0A133XUB8_9LACT|nr:hypothetical protein HMPREF3187_01296 [Aerococcus christensenii]
MGKEAVFYCQNFLLSKYQTYVYCHAQLNYFGGIYYEKRFNY